MAIRSLSTVLAGASALAILVAGVEARANDAVASPTFGAEESAGDRIDGEDRKSVV